jgi:hypothetical protein
MRLTTIISLVFLLAVALTSSWQILEGAMPSSEQAQRFFSRLGTLDSRSDTLARACPAPGLHERGSTDVLNARPPQAQSLAAAV